ncbi:MAG: SAM-dependent methyltransferase [Phenylobacterium zucineum]|nr:MAG: SAM-dependent methyltransferase [Phenylobacterium zucineum]
MPGLDEAAEALAPTAWQVLAARTVELGFDMPSEPRTGALLRTLAAAKPGGRLLELGTGTGLATACLLAGMDAGAALVTVDNDPRVQAVAREALDHDPRVTFVLEDGAAFIGRQPPASFDLVFADAMPGKYEALDAALALVRPGGFWIGDDMLPQPNWPEGHQTRVGGLIDAFRDRPGWAVTEMAWASGLILATRRAT